MNSVVRVHWATCSRKNSKLVASIRRGLFSSRNKTSERAGKSWCRHSTMSPKVQAFLIFSTYHLGVLTLTFWLRDGQPVPISQAGGRSRSHTSWGCLLFMESHAFPVASQLSSKLLLRFYQSAAIVPYGDPFNSKEMGK